MTTMTGTMRLQQVEQRWLRERVKTPSLSETLRRLMREARGRDAGYMSLVEARRRLEFGQLLDMKWSGTRV